MEFYRRKAGTQRNPLQEPFIHQYDSDGHLIDPDLRGTHEIDLAEAMADHPLTANTYKPASQNAVFIAAC
jgi:hypothetical protein